MYRFKRLLRRHVGAALAAGGFLLLVAGVGVGWAIGSSTSSTSSNQVSTATSTAPAVSLPPTSTDRPATPPKGSGPQVSSQPEQPVRTAVIGRLTGVTGSTWTLTSSAGATMTVSITPQTLFGTKKVPAAQSQFAVGQTVRITGEVTGSTITAQRIVMR